MISGVAASLAAVAAFGGLGYYIGRDTATSETNFLEKQLEMFQSAEGANSLLQYLEDLSEYNDNLFEFSKHAEEIAQRETRIARLESQNAQLSEDLGSVSGELDRLTSEKSVLEAQIVDLRKTLALNYSIETEVTIREGES